jgi:drug/metabolite transporter (DMT)-like permease
MRASRLTARTRTLQADVLLLLAAIIWGAAFVSQRLAMQHIGPLTFIAARYALGAVALLPLIHFRRHRFIPVAFPILPETPTAMIPPAEPSLPYARSEPARATASVIVGLLAAGALMFLGSVLQQTGLVSTSAGKGGFITGLYVVLVPLLGMFIGHRIKLMTWVGVALATAGLYFLCVTSGFTMPRGDILVTACALVWAGHVLLTGWLARRSDPLLIAFTQFAVTAVLALVLTPFFEAPTVGAIWQARWSILYAGLLAVGVAFTLQVIGQRHAPPSHAALILSQEAVFAALAGWLLLNESFGRRELFGAALMLAGIVAAELPGVLRPAGVQQRSAGAAQMLR